MSSKSPGEDVKTEIAEERPKTLAARYNQLLDRLPSGSALVLLLSTMSFIVCVSIFLRPTENFSRREEYAFWIFGSTFALSALALAVRGQKTDSADSSRETTSTKLSSWLLVACLFMDGVILLRPFVSTESLSATNTRLTTRELYAIQIFTSFGAAFAAYYFWVSFRRVKPSFAGDSNPREETTKWLALATLTLFSIVVGIAFLGSMILSGDKFKETALEIFKNGATVAGTLITTVIGFYFGSDQAKKATERQDSAIKSLTEALRPGLKPDDSPDPQ